MKIKLSAHGSWRHEYHIVWIPKYRRSVLKLGVKTYVERGINEIVNYHPEIEIIKYNVQIDHVHLIIEIPPKYSLIPNSVLAFESPYLYCINCWL